MTDKPTVNPKPRLAGIKFSIFITLIISLAALAGSGFMVWQYWRNASQLPSWQLSALRLQQQVKDINSALTQKMMQGDTALGEAVKHLQAQQSELAKHQQPGMTANSLNLMATKTSIAMAQTLLLSNVDPLTTSGAINQAMLNIPTLSNHTEPLRQVLAQARADTLALPPLQATDALQQLDSIEAGLSTLAFAHPVSKTKQPTSEPINWRHPQQAAAQVWQHIKGLVVIRRDPTIGQHLLSDAARLNAVELLMLQINTVRWDVATHAKAYAANVAKLKAMVAQFTIASPAQAAVLKNIDTLQGLTVYYPPAQVQKIQQDLTQAQQLINQLLTSAS